MSRRLAVNGVQLACDHYGTGEVFVLVHGWTGSSRTWDGVLGQLAASHTVITYDHRGHGESTNTGDAATYTFDQLVSDLAAVVDLIELDDFHLLGHSMGGIIAIRYALAQGKRIRSLVLMDTGARPATGSREVMQPIIDLVERGGIRAYYEAAIDYVAPPGSPDRQRRLAAFRREIELVDPIALVTLAAELTSYPSVLEELDRLTTPTTVIVGEHDVGLRPAASDLVDAIRGAVLEVVPDAAHMPHQENPDAWLTALELHFGRLPTRSAQGAR